MTPTNGRSGSDPLLALGLVALAVTATAGPLGAQLLAVAGRAEGRLALIDLATMEEVGSFDTGPEPHELAARPGSGLVWAPSYAGSGITEVDLATGETRTLAVEGDSLHDVAVSPDGRRLWATAETDSAVLEIDARSGEVLRRWRHGLGLGHMIDVSDGGRLLWVPDLNAGGVARIDRASDEIRIVPLGVRTEALDVSPDGAEIWVTGVASDEVVVLDSAGAVLDRFSSGGDLPVKLVMSPDGRRVWVSNNRSGTVAVFDRKRRERVGEVAVGGRPLGIGFSADGARAYVTRPGAAEIVEIDAGTLEVLRRIPGPRSADGVVWLPTAAGGG